MYKVVLSIKSKTWKDMIIGDQYIIHFIFVSFWSYCVENYAAWYVMYHKFMIVQWWLLSSLHLWNTTNSEHNYNYLPICFVENCLAWDQYFTIQWRILWGVQVGRWRIWQCFQMCPSTRWLYIRHQEVKNTSSWQRVWVSNDLFVLGQHQWLIKIDM